MYPRICQTGEQTAAVQTPPNLYSDTSNHTKVTSAPVSRSLPSKTLLSLATCTLLESSSKWPRLHCYWSTRQTNCFVAINGTQCVEHISVSSISTPHLLCTIVTEWKIKTRVFSESQIQRGFFVVKAESGTYTSSRDCYIHCLKMSVKKVQNLVVDSGAFILRSPIEVSSCQL